MLSCIGILSQCGKATLFACVSGGEQVAACQSLVVLLVKQVERPEIEQSLALVSQSSIRDPFTQRFPSIPSLPFSSFPFPDFLSLVGRQRDGAKGRGPGGKSNPIRWADRRGRECEN